MPRSFGDNFEDMREEDKNNNGAKSPQLFDEVAVSHYHNSRKCSVEPGLAFYYELHFWHKLPPRWEENFGSLKLLSLCVPPAFNTQNCDRELVNRRDGLQNSGWMLCQSCLIMRTVVWCEAPTPHISWNHLHDIVVQCKNIQLPIQL